MSHNTLNTLGKKVLDLGHSGKTFMNDPELQRKLSKVKKDTETIIRRRPLISLGVGLFAGFLLGKLLSRD
ncbi:MAG TPA: hypothetical protein DCE78_05870 [Bacteroidetes bacterium]|nr:hypothetical protein [Bacteroidota bacterium]